MDDNEREKKSGWIKILAWLPVLLVLYFLSEVPASWIVHYVVPPRHQPVAWEIVDFIYVPLMLILDQSETVRALYNWYANLWFPA